MPRDDDDLLLEPWKRHIPTALVPKPPSPRPATPHVIIDAIEARTDSLIIQRLALKKGIILTSTPKLNGLQDAFTAFTARVEKAAEALINRMDSVAGTTEGAVEKFGGAVEKVAVTAKSIDDAANQLTNGGPPLGNS